MPAVGISRSQDMQEGFYCTCVDVDAVWTKDIRWMMSFAVLPRRAPMTATQHGIISPCQRRTQQDGSLHQVARC